VILQFEAIGARVPDFVDRPLVEGVWPLWRGDRPLPGWVFGNRYTRNLTSLAFPGVVSSLPTWAGWATVLPLVGYQVCLIVLMIGFVRKPDADDALKVGIG
jgi:hypothetical protein